MFTVDRIEGCIVVIETKTGEFFDLPVEIFPSDIKEGDICFIKKDGIEKERREKRVSEKLNNLFKK